jgi:hypothetical protein
MTLFFSKQPFSYISVTQPINTCRNMRYLKLMIVFLLFSSAPMKAGDWRFGAVVPGVHVGYIFNAGLSFGAEVNYTPYAFDAGAGRSAVGAYGSLTYFFSKGELYRATLYHTFSAGAVAFSDNAFMFKAGVCKTVLRWGMNSRNKTKSKKITPEIDLSYAPLKNGLFVGYRIFFPGNACFGLDIATAHELYGAYRFTADRKLFVVERD